MLACVPGRGSYAGCRSKALTRFFQTRKVSRQNLPILIYLFCLMSSSLEILNMSRGNAEYIFYKRSALRLSIRP